MYITKETKRHPSCRRYDNSYAAGPILIRTIFPDFTLNNLMGRDKTILEPGVFRARPSVSFQRVANAIIWFFTERDCSQKC